MKVKANQKYIKLPVNQNSVKKKIEFYNDENLVFDLDCHLDMISPKQVHYADISHLKGMDIEIKVNPEMDFKFEFIDEIPMEGVYYETYRPQVHFSAKKGWLNDPNGLFYANNNYHLFFQYNPAGAIWDNMHWGHAISKDLVHWTELDVALLPDEMGTMYSGSAFVDKNNASGLKENENDVILLFYTAAGNSSKLSIGKKFTQCLAYSTDNGATFKKYENNPIVPNFTDGNRDPKVIYSKELEKYIMAIFLEGNDYMLLVSDDLIHWIQFQKIQIENDGECPDIYPLQVVNEPDTYKWVISGASDKFIVGSIDKHKKCFNIEQKSQAYRQGSGISYAAQTFDNTGDRRIKIAWEMVKCPDSPFNSQMGIPCDVSLYKVRNEYRLRTLPVHEFESLRGTKIESTNVSVNKENTFKIKSLDKNSYEVNMIINSNTEDFDFSLFGIKMNVNLRTNTIKLGEHKLPLSYSYDNYVIRMIIDSCGVELFVDNGLIYTADLAIADYNLNTLTISTDTCATIDNVTVYTLKNIWRTY